MKRQRNELEMQMRDLPARTETEETAAELEAGFRGHWLRLVQLADCRGKLILDAGCGLGPCGRILAKQGNQVVGVDIAPGLMEIALRLSDREGLPFHPVVANLDNLPFKDGTFDVCVLVAVLHHFPAPAPALKAIAASLKPGGIIAFSEPNGSNPYQRWTRPVAKRIFGSYLQGVGLGTDNATAHSHRVYADALRSNGFVNLRIVFHNTLPQSPQERRAQQEWKRGLNPVFRLLIRSFEFVGLVFEKILPLAYGASTLAIVAEKGKNIGYDNGNIQAD